MNDEPVQAGPPATGHRVSKFVRKHRVGVAAAAGLVLVLVVATVVSIRFAVRANREREAATREEEARRKVVDFFRANVLRALSPGRTRDEDDHDGPEVRLRDSIDGGRIFARNLAVKKQSRGGLSGRRSI